MVEKKLVESVANLAKLKLSEEEKERFTKEISQILAYADKLNELDTDGVEPTAYTAAVKNVLREDKVKESLPRQKTLENAPEKKDGHFKAPKIMSD